MLVGLAGAAAPTRADFLDAASGENAEAAYNPTRDSIDSFVTITFASGEDDHGRWQSTVQQPIATDVVIAASMFETLYAPIGTGTLFRVETDEALRSLEVGLDQATVELPQSSLGDALFDIASPPVERHVGGVVPEPVVLVLMLVGLPIVIARPRRTRAGVCC